MPSLVPLIPITLDRPRQLRLDNRAIFQAERELSRLWEKRCSLFNVLANDLGLNDLSVILWQALLHEDPRLTLADVQNELMDMAKLPEIIDAVLQAWNAATTPAITGASANGEVGETDPLPTGSPGTTFGPMPALS
jgi:hypothetical protein